LGKIKEMTGLNLTRDDAKKGTIAYPILEAHNVCEVEENLKMKFDSLTFTTLHM
jgi:aconitate hydratase